MSRPVLIVIGPSGVGKSSIFTRLRREGTIEIVPTWTTRPMRHDERRDDTDHVFCTEAEFEERMATHFFMETARPFGLDARYGLPHLSMVTRSGRIQVLMARASVMRLVPQHLENYVVYQVEAPFGRVREHLALRARRDGPQGSRLADFRRELTAGRRYARRIIDNTGPLHEVLKRVRNYLGEDFAEWLAASA